MVVRTTLIALLLSAAACGRLGYEAVDAGGIGAPESDAERGPDGGVPDGPIGTSDGGAAMEDGGGPVSDAGPGVDGGGGGGPTCGERVCSAGQRCCTGDGCSLCVDGRVCPMISCGI